MTDPFADTMGALAGALAKAQADFPVVTKDKEVVVQKKTGGTYKFSYAPLDSILTAVRKPLADNGLVVVQLLDDGALVTMLLHESGARISGSVALPDGSDIQGFGSAITYLRRYALQALLGIAAEDDDDGNRAAGNTTTNQEDHGHEKVELLGNLTKTGKLVKGTADGYKAAWREAPTGHTIGFRLKIVDKGEDKDVPQFAITGAIGEALFLYTEGDPKALLNVSITAKGRLYGVRPAEGGFYYRMVVGEVDGHHIETPDVRVPALPDESPPSEPPAGEEARPEAASVPLPFDMNAVDAEAQMQAADMGNMAAGHEHWDPAA